MGLPSGLTRGFEIAFLIPRILVPATATGSLARLGAPTRYRSTVLRAIVRFSIKGLERSPNLTGFGAREIQIAPRRSSER